MYQTLILNENLGFEKERVDEIQMNINSCYKNYSSMKHSLKNSKLNSMKNSKDYTKVVENFVSESTMYNPSIQSQLSLEVETQKN